MIDPTTGWFAIYDDKRAITIANIVEFTLLTRYPRAIMITVDHGKKIIEHGFQKKLCTKEYGIDVKVATTATPQANSIVEQIHQRQKTLKHQMT